MKYIDKIEHLLPLGYVFLVLMGIIKESVFFYQIGINILTYSSIMDILISPLATLTSNPFTLIAVIIIIVLHFYLPNILLKNDHKNWVRKLFELKKTKDELSAEDLNKYYITISIKTLCTSILSIFLGFGLAGGYFISKKIKNNKLEYDYKLNYNSGESENVFIINSNTEYYFYIAKGNQTIKIAPVASIKNIELTNNRMLNK
ncbi:hypothetical protein [Flavobacterium sp. 5]|uniref:hypothetical protein n=1 Tax=Flavobacterium sp. 5 TaxID=2035199 RepID=UPI000C2CB2B5|nr:hypothetical protein [Flavobacterium sp. 5]PKB17859.1 hypothetical protein CLU82_3107 [Flavobacterium sp. 5]